MRFGDFVSLGDLLKSGWEMLREGWLFIGR